MANSTQPGMSDPLQHSIHPPTPPIYPLSSLNRWQGDNVLNTAYPSNNITRILFQNINGLKTSKTSISDSIQDLQASLETHNIQIACFSEHQLPVHNPKTHVKILLSQQKAARRNQFYLQLDSSHDPGSLTERLMGGTGIATRAPILGRTAPNGRGGDKWGRWTYCRYNRHNATDLVIISIYQVCRNPSRKIGHTAFHQQRNALNAAHRDQEHPRAAFLTDLKQFIQQQQEAHRVIIVGGDWNDHLEAPRSSLLHLCTSLNLVDPWMVKNPESPTFATHHRGQHRIDSVLISPVLLSALHTISYTPVGLFCNSDHRGIILDWNTERLFGPQVQRDNVLLQRTIRSNDRHNVTKYIETMHSHLLCNNSFARAISLDNYSIATDQAITLAENLDHLIGEAGTAGENKCTRRRATWYSNTIVKARLEISYLKHHRNGLQLGQDRSFTTRFKLDAVGSDLQIPTTLEAIDTLITELLENLHAKRQEDFRLRQQFLDIEHPEATRSKSGKKKDPRSKIKKNEVAKQTWSTLAAITNAKNTNQLDRLEIPNDWPPPIPPDASSPTPALSDPKEAQIWKTITDPTEIEQYLLMRNQIHFGQAKGTPFTTEPLQSSLDWGATTTTVDELLEGTYVPPNNFPSLCKAVLASCHHCTSSDIIPAHITKEEFKGKMTTWDETTTTSPSGRHLGRYKALFSKGIYTPAESDEAIYFQKQQDDIVSVILSILNFCIRTGYVPSRWKQIVNIMIFKDQGNFKIHRLRIIHLYEADLNLFMAVKWRQLLQTADQKSFVNTNQYGGRPGREATSLALLEELKLDISYASRRTLITFDNDAMSCYDRIIPSFASVINRKYGMPTKVTRLHGTMLQQAQYRLRTANGVSDISYSHTESQPIYGSGQGSGNSPVLWLLISATLFDVYENHAIGSSFSSPDGTTQASIKISGFVDDTNISLNSWQPQSQPPIITMMSNLRHDAQCWNDLLFISGGKLELSKCSFHILEFEFDPNGTPRCRSNCPQPISLLDSVTARSIDIPALPSTAPHKILGHWKAPAGQATTQLGAIKSKAKATSILLATSPVSRYGAKLGYMGKYVAALRYVLPQCHFPVTVLRKAERSSLPAIISKSGFSSKTAHELLFTPTSMGGGGFIHWDVIQSVGQITHFVKHWRSQSQISDILRINVAWTQWQAGTSLSIFHYNAFPLDYLEARWLTSFRLALQSAHATVRLDTTYIPPPERSHDPYIMDVAHASKQFSSTETRILNYCRMYLHVTTVSELFTVSGNQLLPHMRTGHKPRWFDPHLILPIQQRPNDYHWRNTWTKLCTLIIPHGRTLGRWRNSSRPLRLRREAYIDQGRLYYWHAGQYWHCSPVQISKGQRYILHEASEWLPIATSKPVDIIARVINTIYCDKPVSSQAPRPVATPPETFAEYANAQQEKTIRDMLTGIHWHKSPFECQALLFHTSPDNPILVVSDGSAYGNRSMSYGVVIGTHTGEILIECQGRASGPITSHRAECTGCLVGATVLYHLAVFTNTPLPCLHNAKAISDNKSMIDHLISRQTYQYVYANATLKTDWDSLEEIHHLYSQLSGSTISYEWVKGHQDTPKNPTATTPLSIEAIYNIQADQLAGQVIHEDLRPHIYKTPFLSQTRCTLEIAHQSVQGHYSDVLRESIATSDYRAYLERKHQWGPSTYDDVDWTAFRIAARSYFATEVHLLKLVHDQLPTRGHVSRFQPWIPPRCHFCTEKETFLHLQTCPCHPLSDPFRHKLRTKVDEYLTQFHLPAKFHQDFLFALNISLGAPPPPSLTTRFAKAQAAVGWYLLPRGFLSTQWRHHLQQTIREAGWAESTADASSDHDTQWFLDSLSDADDATPTYDSAWFEHSDEDTTTSSFDNRPPNPYTHKLKQQLQTAATQARSHRTLDLNVFLAGLIKLMWGELGQFWLDHLALVHGENKSSSSAEHISNLKTHVRLLQKLKQHAMPQHRQQYFLAHLDTFLLHATQAQLQQYIATYKPHILDSVCQAAQDQPPLNSSIAQLIGHILTWQPPVPLESQAPSLTLTPNSTTGAFGEAPHRKRNRLRNGIRRSEVYSLSPRRCSSTPFLTI